MKTNPWFRLYTEMVDDEKLRLLAFEDRWHYVALLCCKNSGLLDREQDRPMLLRKLGVKLGLASADLDSALLRLSEVGLITLPDCQPMAWEKRQYLPNKGLPGTEDENDKRCYVYFIAEKGSDRVKIGFSKNPWARLKNLQTASSGKMEIVCHLRTSGVSEAEIHRLLSEYNVGGEWYLNEGLVADSIAAIKSGSVTDASHLEKLLSSGAISQVAKKVATTVAATTDTDTDTDTEQKKKEKASPAGSRLPDDWTPPEEWLSWARSEKPGINALQEADKFKDYWSGVPGAKGRKANWQATWRNWIRNAKLVNGYSGNGGGYGSGQVEVRRRNEL